jgi:hypothetical protein
MNRAVARRAIFGGLAFSAARGAWAQMLPSVNGQRPEVAFISHTTSDASPAQRGFTKALADQIRARLSGDPSITVLPAAMNDNAIVGTPVAGFVGSAGELTQAVHRLPAICNIVVVFGPHPGPSRLFPVRVARRATLAGITFQFGPVNGDVPTAAFIDQVLDRVRRDIAVLSK